MASFTGGLAGRCASGNYRGIYLGLVKENFPHECAAIVPASLQCDPAKQIFESMGGGSQYVARSVVYIYINCPLKNVI